MATNNSLTITLNGQKYTLSELQKKSNGQQAFTAVKAAAKLISRFYNPNIKTFHFYSSGSTGAPKKIILGKNALEQSALTTLHFLKIAPNSVLWICIPTQFIGGTMALIRGLVHAMEIWISVPTSHPLQHYTGPTPQLVSMVPVQLWNAFQDGSIHLLTHDTTHVLIGGGMVTSALQQRLRPLNGNFWATFGMTETASHFALQRLNGPNAQDHYTVLPGFEIETDENDCLKVKGITTGRKWVHTNDVVTILSKNTFIWKGRFDFQINSGGIKLNPEQLELKIALMMRQHFPLIEKYMICGIYHPVWGNSPVLVLETTEIPEAVKQYVDEILIGPEKIRNYHAIKVFPMTENGKLKRKDIIAQLANAAL